VEGSPVNTQLSNSPTLIAVTENEGPYGPQMLPGGKNVLFTLGVNTLSGLSIPIPFCAVR